MFPRVQVGDLEVEWICEEFSFFDEVVDWWWRVAPIWLVVVAAFIDNKGLLVGFEVESVGWVDIDFAGGGLFVVVDID